MSTHAHRYKGSHTLHVMNCVNVILKKYQNISSNHHVLKNIFHKVFNNKTHFHTLYSERENSITHRILLCENGFSRECAHLREENFDYVIFVARQCCAVLYMAMHYGTFHCFWEELSQLENIC